MKKSRAILPLLLVLSMLLLATFGFTKGIEDQQISVAKSSATSLNQNTTNRTLINIGQIAMWIYSNGQSALNPSGNSGLFFPRGNNPPTATIFQDGLVWGGNVDDGAEPVLRVGGTQYAVGHVAGAITSRGVAEDRSDPAIDRIWRVRRNFATADLTLDAAEFNSIQTSAVTPAQIQQVRDLYRQDWIDWPVHKGAPYYDADGDGNYTPGFKDDGSPKLAPGEGIDFDPLIHADEPGIADADQVVWLVSNDLTEAVTRGFAGAPPIGLEQQITLWGYARSDALGQIIFKQFRLIYKGTSTTPPTAKVEDMYLCQWSDPDVGSSGDDLAGCDTTLSLGFAYNSGASDATFSSVGLPPPASGYDFFAGPLVEDPNGEAIFGLKKRAGFRNLPMTTFASFSAGSQAADPGTLGSPEVTPQWYNLLRGFLPRPSDVVNPTAFLDPTNNNAPTKFTLYGDPITNKGWVDTGSGDRRILLSSGPFTLAFGDTQETVVATLSALGTDRLSSVSLLKFVDRSAQEAFDNLFNLPKPPPPPVLTASEMDGEIFLNWAGDVGAINNTESHDVQGQIFEGYNVYQLPTAGSTLDQAERIATFDLVNNFTTIAQESFDISSGLILELPQQFGNNTGIERTFTISDDVIRGLGLINGQTYYFGVSAYSINPDPDATLRTLESTMAVVTVVPQTTKPGVRLQAETGETIQAEHAEGGSDGGVTVIFNDPGAVTGDSYQVTFIDTFEVVITPHEGAPSDTTNVPLVLWNLQNTTTGEMLLTNQVNQSGDANYFVTEGFTAVVTGAPNSWKDFSVIANAAGPIDPPEPGAAEFQGFPLLPDAHARPTVGGQQVAGGRWFFAAGGGTPEGAFTTFVSRVGRNDNFSRIIPFDYEMRFTAEGSMGHWWAESGAMGAVPFELWNIGINTPDDPSDDYRMCPRVLNDINFGDAETNWDIGANGGAGGDDSDHGTSGGADDPYTDWVYWMNPADTSPGSAGYEAFVSSAGATVGGEVLARTILVNWNGGDVTDPTFPENLNQQLPEEGTIFRIITTKPNTPNDVFTFSTSGYEPIESTEMAQSDVAKMVNVFPNPYYGVNSFEENRFNRKITFSHLPERATIRIFNLAGVLVRTLEKDDPSQFIDWNLQNESSLPVASGIYVANIEMPDLGTSKNLKIALIKEQEFLRRF